MGCRVDLAGLGGFLELELELIQSHMAQKPVLRGEVGCACVAREVSVEWESEATLELGLPGTNRARPTYKKNPEQNTHKFSQDLPPK